MVILRIAFNIIMTIFVVWSSYRLLAGFIEYWKLNYPKDQLNELRRKK